MASLFNDGFNQRQCNPSVIFCDNGVSDAGYSGQVLSFSVADHFALYRALIDAGQPFFHCRCEQRNVWEFAEIFGDEPDRFVRRHPVQMIETCQVHRA